MKHVMWGRCDAARDLLKGTLGFSGKKKTKTSRLCTQKLCLFIYSFSLFYEKELVSIDFIGAA